MSCEFATDTDRSSTCLIAANAQRRRGIARGWALLMASLRSIVVLGVTAGSLCDADLARADEVSNTWGTADTLGHLNYLHPDKTLDGLATVRTGKVYALGMVTSESTPAWGDRSYRVRVSKLDPEGPDGLSATDDVVTSHMGIGTQIDGFAHIGRGGIHYNGHKLEDFFSPDGVRKFGMAALPPIATRGVLLDITALKGVDHLPKSYVISADDLRDSLAKQALEITRGDVVLVHTGWMQTVSDDEESYVYSPPGLDREAAQILAEFGVVAIGADTGSLEVRPSVDPDDTHPVHTLLLKDYGIHILENIVTQELADDRVSEFLFVLGVPRYKGAVQAIINPVAIH